MLTFFYHYLPVEMQKKKIISLSEDQQIRKTYAAQRRYANLYTFVETTVVIFVESSCFINKYTFKVTVGGWIIEVARS